MNAAVAHDVRGAVLASLRAIRPALQVIADDEGLKPFETDGLATQGLAIEKSHWCRPIETAPFRAFPIISANCFTFGGLKVNTAAQVLDNDGKVMAGLYAAGETVGLYHQTYNGATSVLRGAVFGRTAGLHAAAVRGASAG